MSKLVPYCCLNCGEKFEKPELSGKCDLCSSNNIRRLETVGVVPIGEDRTVFLVMPRRAPPVDFEIVADDDDGVFVQIKK